MRLYQIINEANVNSTILSANKLISNSISELVKDLYSNLDAKDVVNDSDATDAFMKKVRPELAKRKDAWVVKLSKDLSALVRNEIENKYGKITRHGDHKHDVDFDDKWKTLWWVNEPIVWISEHDRPGQGKETYGYFTRDSEKVRNDFPRELTSHLDHRRDIAIGIALYSPIDRLFEAINNEIFENIVASNHVGFRVSSEEIRDIIHGIVSTLSHEVKHLFHYITQNLTTEPKRIPQSQDLYSQSNFLPKRKRNYKVRADDIFDKIDLPTYLMTATEVDAFATSVASKIILQSASDNPRYEIQDLEDALQNLSVGYTDSRVFAQYYDEIKAHGKQFDRVWKRFLKKITSEITARIEELKSELAR